MSQIADACLILSIFDANPNIAAYDHITLDVSVYVATYSCYGVADSTSP